jgi:hypothetical protein
MANPQSSRQIQSLGLMAGMNYIWVVLSTPEFAALARLTAGDWRKKRRGAKAPHRY